jgi:hypothetical protein
MDQPASNEPAADLRSVLQMPQGFVAPTGGASLFMPCISALNNELSAGTSG